MHLILKDKASLLYSFIRFSNGLRDSPVENLGQFLHGTVKIPEVLGAPFCTSSKNCVPRLGTFDQCHFQILQIYYVYHRGLLQNKL